MEPKKISIHHLYYTIAIAIIILVCAVLIVPCYVSDKAYENFSFASTITSIVLAVVSIVYSIQSGNASSQQLNSVRDIDAEIKRQLDSFGHIEENVSKLLDGGMTKIQDDVKRLSDGQTEISTRLNNIGKEMNVKDGTKTSSGETDFSNNSAYGNVILYACSLSFKNKKNLPREIFDEDIADYNYWFGYLIALKMSMPDKFMYKLNANDPSPLSSIVTNYDEKTFGTSESLHDKLLAYVKDGKNLDRLKKYISDIDEYYGARASE